MFLLSFVLSPIEYELFLNISIWSIDGTPTGTTTPGPSRPGDNNNEGVLYTLPIPRTGSPPFMVGVLPLCSILDFANRAIHCKTDISCVRLSSVFFLCLWLWLFSFFNLSVYTLVWNDVPSYYLQGLSFFKKHRLSCEINPLTVDRSSANSVCNPRWIIYVTYWEWSKFDVTE